MPIPLPFTGMAFINIAIISQRFITKEKKCSHHERIILTYWA
uniref:Uncharacterized protein n=1 Tax=Setaria italica TaxID=4555 RepID=K3XTK0_SETIT